MCLQGRQACNQKGERVMKKRFAAAVIGVICEEEF